jgi:uncharacterized protein (DUF1684 family)
MKYIVILVLFISQQVQADTWAQELDEWKTKRVTSLTRPHGWLSLIGMEWLHKGENSIGSASDNSIILPHGPEYIGSFFLNNNNIVFNVKAGVEIKANKESVTSQIPVMMDSSGEPTVFTIDSFQFHVIERGKPALRIKDSSAKALADFKGLKYFKTSEKFKVQAEFIAYNPVKEIEIINVLGLLSKDKALGKLRFSIDGKEYLVDVLDAGEDYYIIFADKTSGRTSYGPGRFLYVPKANQDNLTTIDFNKAYNPPCAFSNYSTCPLPPPQNRIAVYIQAGEMIYEH